MKQLYITLEAISPLTIRSDHAPDGAETIKYIPGSAFVGGLAAIHRLLRPDGIDEFERLFLHEQVLYSNLYPAVFRKPLNRQEKGLQERELPIYPLPKTALSCKRHPGFLFPAHKDNDAHGVRDSLLERAIFSLSFNEDEQFADYRPENKTRTLAALLEHKHCPAPNCQEAMDHFDGYYRRSDLNPKQMIATQAKRYTRLRTHTGIHRESGTVQENILYNRQVFEEGTKFRGMIKIPDDPELLPVLQSFLKTVGDEQLVRLGTGRSRGMGKVTLKADLIEDKPDRFTKFKERLDTFNKLVHKQISSYHLRGLDDRYFFAITLHSPLLLCDEFLRYRGTIDEKALTELLHYQIPGLQRLYQAAALQRVTGWQELWGLPRINEYAIETGSVFLFACQTQPDETLYRALFDLEENGAGKQQAEGLGQLCVSDQFHQEIQVQ